MSRWHVAELVTEITKSDPPALLLRFGGLTAPCMLRVADPFGQADRATRQVIRTLPLRQRIDVGAVGGDRLRFERIVASLLATGHSISPGRSCLRYAPANGPL
ncbi:MAG: hypothetical protein ABS35_32660 [Kaistia sp. SCN 65-12]|nr:MAG: hypothetical protein ABS35_32660 [Kaistia sp. SCN 65-12]